MSEFEIRIPRLLFLRDCLIRKFELWPLYESSHFSELIIMSRDGSARATLTKHGHDWSLNLRTSEGSSEIQNEANLGRYSVWTDIEGLTGSDLKFETWLGEVYQNLSSGYVKKALFEATPPSEFDSRLEERISFGRSELNLI